MPIKCCMSFIFEHYFHTGGNCKDHEDAKTNNKCSITNGTGRDTQEHVSPVQEDDKGADRMADWTQVHEAWWGQYQHVHLHGIIHVSYIRQLWMT